MPGKLDQSGIVPELAADQALATYVIPAVVDSEY
jgi:hypothetical protein